MKALSQCLNPLIIVCLDIADLPVGRDRAHRWMSGRWWDRALNGSVELQNNTELQKCQGSRRQSSTSHINQVK